MELIFIVILLISYFLEPTITNICYQLIKNFINQLERMIKINWYSLNQESLMSLLVDFSKLLEVQTIWINKYLAIISIALSLRPLVNLYHLNFAKVLMLYKSPLKSKIFVI